MSGTKNKICKICGSENQFDSKFCEDCGGKFEGGGELTEKNRSGGSANDPVKSGDKKVKNRKESVKVLGRMKLFYIAFSLLLIGFLIIYASGIFDQPVQNSIENPANGQSDDPHRGVDMSSLQEINNLQEILKENPSDHDSMLKLAHLLNDSGFYQKAIEYYRNYLKAFPRNADVFVDMGVCYFELRDYDNAVRAMKTAIEYVPQHQIAHFNLGIVNFSFDKHDEAISWWQKAIAIDPNSQIARKAQEFINNH